MRFGVVIVVFGFLLGAYLNAVPIYSSDAPPPPGIRTGDITKLFTAVAGVAIAAVGVIKVIKGRDTGGG
jgi:hypothetical protein